MSNFEGYYLAAIPHDPPKPYAFYDSELQPASSNARQPEALLSWDSFEAICSSYQPDTRHQLQEVLPTGNRAIDKLTPEINVWILTADYFYKLLSNISLELDGADVLMWRSGGTTRSDCDAHLELEDCGVVACGTMLPKGRAGGYCACRPHGAA